jgi:hypothetical protein
MHRNDASAEWREFFFLRCNDEMSSRAAFPAKGRSPVLRVASAFELAVPVNRVVSNGNV